MKLRDMRLWVLVLAMAFLVLWVVSVGVAYAAPAQEPVPELTQAAPSPGLHSVGVAGWCLVGLGFFAVAAAVFWGNRPVRRRRPPRSSRVTRQSARPFRVEFSPPPGRRYRSPVERRYH